ncbi:MAG: transcription termination factor Rho, partial [Chloroflexi bacterium]|nr:transcription termination factor Rho [Chloroflexota bacterium]
MNIAELENKSPEELTALIHEQGIADGDLPANIQRDELVYRLLKGYAEQEGYQIASGVLELMSDGYGFLRQNGRRPGQSDVYVSQSQA